MSSSGPGRAAARPAARPATGAVRRPPGARPSAAARRRAVRRRRGRVVARVLLVGVLTVMVGATTFVGGLLAAPFDETAVPPPPKSVLLLANDGTQFATIRPPERREIVPPEAIPDVMRKAIMAAEDSRFLDHNGVDPLATMRAAFRDLTGGRRQGGSTITQQYVKNAYVGSERTYLRKIREAAISVRLESRKDKEDILTDYLNVLYLGNSVYGVQAASRYYFGVDIQDLDLDNTPGRGGRRDANLALARAAMLAGIAPAPSAWNPVRDFATAKVRQQYTLNQMVTNGWTTPAEASAAFRRGVAPVRETPPELPTMAPEFADFVTAQLRREYAGEREDVLFRGGLRVQTTLDMDLQEATSRALQEVLPDADDPQAAAVAIDIRNGEVRAMSTLRRVPPISGPDGVVSERVNGYQRGGFNLATNGYRSTGSTIKPFTLAVALEQGMSLGTRRAAPACNRIPDRTAPDGVYAPCNSGESGYRGTITLRQALAGSVNTVFVPLAIEVGRPRIKEVMLASGIQTNPSREFSTLPNSFGLGATAEVTPLSLANAYGTLMNHGIHQKPRYVTEIRRGDEGGEGAVVEKPEIGPGTRALPAEVADAVADAMAAVTKPGGTARAAAREFEVFGKTGTTNDSVDSWFVGCARSPQNLCIAVWMGYDRQQCAGVVGRDCGGMKNVNGVRQVYGGTLPARVFARTFDILREIQAEKARGESAGGSEAPAEAELVADEAPAPTAPRTRAPRPAATTEPAPAPAAPAPPRTEAPAPPPPAPPPSSEPPRTLLPAPGGGGGGSTPAPEPEPDGAD